MAGERVRIGILGSGGIANAHMRAYKEIPEAQVVAVCDLIPGRAEQFIARHGLEGARAFTDHREMLQTDLDAVSVCTFHRAHAGPSIDAMRAGKHVLCEKPMAATFNEAMQMAESSEATGRILCIGFQSRYDPNVRMAKQICASGALGEVYYAETGGGRRRGIPGGSFSRKESAGGGAVLDIGCYSLDTALFLLGHPRPRSVSAITASPFCRRPQYAPEGTDVEDFASAFIRLETGATLVFKISWAMHADSLGPSLFLGSEAGLKLQAPGGLGDAGIERIQVFRDAYGKPAVTEVPLRRTDEPRAFLRKVQEFVDAVRTGGPAPIPGHEVLRSMAIIDAIYRSAEHGREVDVATV